MLAAVNSRTSHSCALRLLPPGLRSSGPAFRQAGFQSASSVSLRRVVISPPSIPSLIDNCCRTEAILTLAKSPRGAFLIANYLGFAISRFSRHTILNRIRPIASYAGKRQNDARLKGVY